jgi:Mg2+/Co2+ transporter CorB
MDLDPFSLLYISLTFDIYFFAQFASIIILLFLSGVFSGSEVALFSLKINHLEEIKNTSFDKYKKISQLISDPKKLLATILILNNFANIGLVILFTFLNKILFSNIALDWQKFLIDVILITSILLIFGEVMPKIYASNHQCYPKVYI